MHRSKGDRPKTAFATQLTTSVSLRPETAPAHPDAKLAERDQEKYYTPTTGLGSEVKKAIPSKGKAWQDLLVESVSCTTKDEEGVVAAVTSADFISQFNSFLGAVAVDKAMFNSFVSSMVPIPEVDLSSTKKFMKIAADAPTASKYLPGAWAFNQEKSQQAKTLAEYSRIMSEGVPEPVVTTGVMLFAMVSAVTKVVGGEDPNKETPIKRSHQGTLGPGIVPVSFGDDCLTKVAEGEMSLASVRDKEGGVKSISNLDSKLIVGIDRAYFEKMEFPRTYGRGALPLKPAKSEEVRGTERSELLTFTDFSPNDIDRVTQMVGFERVLNGAYDDVKGSNNLEDWVVTNRMYYEQYRPEVLSQVLAKAMMSEPDSLRRYHTETDSLLLALHHPTAKGRVGQKIWKAEDKIRHKVRECESGESEEQSDEALRTCRLF